MKKMVAAKISVAIHTFYMSLMRMFIRLGLTGSQFSGFQNHVCSITDTGSAFHRYRSLHPLK